MTSVLGDFVTMELWIDALAGYRRSDVCTRSNLGIWTSCISIQPERGIYFAQPGMVSYNQNLSLIHI